jgi:hypothetical protein
LRKIVVFQSDDWGTQRITASNEAENLLLKRKINNEFVAFDTLESDIDLKRFRSEFADLSKKLNRELNMTFNMVMGNPDFEAIKKSDFKEYSVQDLNSSYNYYGFNSKKIKLEYDEMLKSNMFDFQFHSREHVNIKLWLKALNSKDVLIKEAFHLGFWGISTPTSQKFKQSFMATWDETDDIDDNWRIENGIDEFTKYFGFEPSSFVPNNYIFPKNKVHLLEKKNIQSFQGREFLIQPKFNKFFPYRFKLKRETGNTEPGSENIISMVRNVQFEPSKDLFYKKQGINQTDQLSTAKIQIQKAFAKNQIAIVDTHRVNYVSSRNEENANYGINQLGKLISYLVQQYPDIQFMSTQNLTDHFHAIHK